MSPPPHLEIFQLKCGIRRTPPTSFGSPKSTWGGYISCGQGKYFSEISCLTPPKYSRVNGGDVIYHDKPKKRTVEGHNCRGPQPPVFRFSQLGIPRIAIELLPLARLSYLLLVFLGENGLDYPLVIENCH